MKVVGVITDLHTFLVAVSPQAGVDKLAEVNGHYTLPKPVVGSWANGRSVIVGEDCIHITATLKALGPNTATIQTEIKPPQKACLKMLRGWINKPVVAKIPNSFQQKLFMGQGIWGDVGT